MSQLYHFSQCLSSSGRHSASPMSNLLSSFSWKRMPRMVRIKDTTCGFPLLFSSAPLFSSPSNGEKCSWVFVAQPPLLISSLSLSILSLVSPSFSNSYSFLFSSFEDYYRMQSIKLSLKCCFCSAIRGSGFRWKFC